MENRQFLQYKCKANDADKNFNYNINKNLHSFDERIQFSPNHSNHSITIKYMLKSTGYTTSVNEINSQHHSSCACVERSGMTSGSSNTFDSFETDDRDPRSCDSDRFDTGKKKGQECEWLAIDGDFLRYSNIYKNKKRYCWRKKSCFSLLISFD